MLTRLKHALDWRTQALASRLDSLNERLVGLDARVGGLAGHLDTLANTLEQRVEPMLRAVLAEDAENRRRLFALRSSEHYDTPYAHADPLVSITIATHDRAELLTGRALPSLLAQTHANLEVVVVGDCAPPEVGEAVAAIGDRRVRYSNLTQRITAHRDPQRHWLVGSTMARNEATRSARGSWLLHFDDDDQLRPSAIASLLELARDTRAEVAYGGFEAHRPDGVETTVSGFPPEPGRFGWQGALIHGGLRFFERELIAAHMSLPGDIYMLERMLNAGVSFAMLEEIVWDYLPTNMWAPSSTSQMTSQISSTEDGSSSE